MSLFPSRGLVYIPDIQVTLKGQATSLSPVGKHGDET